MSDLALSALIDYVNTLPAPAADHGGHDHGVVGLLAEQEVAQIEHALLVAAIDDGEVANAAHWLVEASADLSGSHLEAMTRVDELLMERDLATARSVVSGMVTDDPSTRGWGSQDLVLWLAMHTAGLEDGAELRHQLGHLELKELDAGDELLRLTNEGAYAAVREQIATLLALEAEPHAEDESDHDSGDVVDHDDEGLAPHQHEEEIVDHDSGDVVDHDDEGLAPHEHEEEIVDHDSGDVVDHDDEGLAPHEHEEEIVDHDDDGLAPHDH